MNGLSVHSLGMTAALVLGALAGALAVADVRRGREGRAERRIADMGTTRAPWRRPRPDTGVGSRSGPEPRRGPRPGAEAARMPRSGPGPARGLPSQAGQRSRAGSQAGPGAGPGGKAVPGSGHVLLPDQEHGPGTPGTPGTPGRPGGPGLKGGSRATAGLGPGTGTGAGAGAGGQTRSRWQWAAESGLVREWGPAAGAGLGVAVLVGGLLGVLSGIGAAFGAWAWLTRRLGADQGAEAGERPDPAELPLCADLMAACLAAGATPGEAAEAVGRCLDGPWGTALIRTRAELRFGAEPEECWERFGRLAGAREMGRCLARASVTGTAPFAEMSRLAADYRAAQTRSALARARKAAVLATAPLGVCFLPAFLLVGVAPVVIGLAGAVLGGRLG